MKFPRKRKRIFGFCILLTMVALALATAVLSASGQWAGSGSYSLVIQKQFAADTPDAVLAEAKKQTYRFHVKGYRLDGDKNKIDIDQTVEIGPNSTDWRSGTMSSDGPIYVTVDEITNDVTLKVTDANGVEQEYNMGDSRAETVTLFAESPQVRELNNNGKIVLSRPATKQAPAANGKFIEVPVTTTSTFRITSRWTAAESAKPEGWTAFDQTVTLAPGSTHTFDKLLAGEYTIEDLSVSGYTVKLGPRKEDVGMETQTGGGPSKTAYSVREGEAKNQTGTFYINSYPGQLKITAGGTSGDGGTHYYTVKRINAPSDARPFVDRTTDAVASKDTYILDDLPKGQYEVTEYTFTDAPTQFTVKVPETEEKTVNYTYQKKFFGTDKAGFTKFPAGGDYITDLKFGPLRNSKNVAIRSDYTYKFAYRYRSAEDGPNKYTTTGTFTLPANKAYSDSNVNRKIIYPRTDGTLAFAVWNVTATTGDHVDLSWVENKLVENPYTKKNANINYSITIDDRGWMEITAPAKSDKPGAESVTYTYTLRKDADGDPLRTVTLAPGEKGRFEGLKAGTYLLMETLSFAEPVGFRMDISGGPVGSMEAGKPSEITVMQPRELTITKPQGKKGDTRDYTFVIDKVPEKTRAANNTQGELTFPIKVTLKAGETSTGILLPAGTYTITPVDDMTEVFELTSSDTSQVHAQVPSDHSASVTFTNVFTAGKYGYRYVHEYYIGHKNADDTYSYTYEGCSPVTTVGGRSDPTEFYNSVDITKEPTFTIIDSKGVKQTNTYAYMPENNGYGKVSTNDTDSGTNAANGLRLHNHAQDKVSGQEIAYNVKDDMTAVKKIGVDNEKSQIIILRYFRVLPEEQKGSYKYIHVYYCRDKYGYHWEGSSPIGENPGQLNNVPYRAGAGKDVQPVTRFQPTEDNPEKRTYDYEYDQRPSYGTLSDDHSDPLVEEHRQVNQSETTHKHYRANSDADHIVATEDGQNIIILRYYREVRQVTGTYKVVHEYYYREKLEDSGAEEDTGDVSGETPEEGAAPESLDPPVGDENGTAPAGLPTEDGDSTAPDDPLQPPEANAPENGGATSADGENSAPTAEGEKDDPPAAGDGDDAVPVDPPAEDGDDAASDNLPQDPEDKNGGAEDGGGESGTTEGAGDGDTPASSPEADSLIAPQNDGPSGTQPDPMPAGNDSIQPPDDGDSSAQPPDDGDGSAQPPENGNDNAQPPDDGDGSVQPPDDGDGSAQPPEGGSDSAQPPEGEDRPAGPGSGEVKDEDQLQVSGNSDPEGNGQSQAPGNDEPEGGDPSQPPENDSLKGGELPLDENAEDTPQGGDASFSGTLSSDGTYTYTFEGARKVETIKAPLGNIYYGTKDDWLLNWSPENDANTYAYENYDVVYGISDSNGGYTYHQNMEWAASTESGEQIIILRYIRGDGVVPDTPDPPTPPTHSEHDPTYAYRVVHEYYLEDADGNRTLEGKTDVKRVVGSKGKTYNESDVTKLPKYNGKEYTYTGDAYGTWSGGQNYDAENGKTYVEATASGNQIIILRYVRKEPPKTEVSYKVIHEYYVRDLEGNETLVGTSEIRAVMEASPDLQYTQADVGREPDFQGETYTYFGDGYGTVSGQDYSEVSGQRYALATMSGDQIIILRYVREEKPEQPSQTPEDPPKDPEHPTEPPDPNDPDSPDEITIWENEIPKTYIKVWDPEKQEWVYLPEVDVPLWNEIPQPGAEIGIPGEDLLITLPQPDGGSYVLAADAALENRVPPTGDESRIGLWVVLAAAALCGCAALIYVPRKRKTK